MFLKFNQRQSPNIVTSEEICVYYNKSKIGNLDKVDRLYINDRLVWKFQAI